VSEALRTINIVAAALGGEGGGVLTDWLIEVAAAEGYLAQTTSLAGVAQRTGATIYYIELYPRAAINDRLPVMSLFPAQGDIDIALASEIAEAGRMVQRGFVTPGRTTLIASTHRVFGITEKIQLGDGAVDADSIERVAARYAQRFLRFNMLAVAEQHGTVISAALLGALAGSGALPFSKSSFEQVIEHAGVAVKANLACFRDCFERAARGTDAPAPTLIPVHVVDPNAAPAEPAMVEPADFVLPQGTTPAGHELLARVRAELPATSHFIVYHALRKLVDYQDADYAHQYLDTLATVTVAAPGEAGADLTTETARYLGLWMCFEDIPRVAQLKIRASRLQKVRAEVRAEPGQIIDVVEFFSPRMEEICGMLPVRLGERLLRSPFAQRVFGWFMGGRQLKTNAISTYTILCLLGTLRRWRRRSWNYREEHALIQRWLDAVRSLVRADLAAAQELAACGRLVKGYGDTRHRTKAQLATILDRCAIRQPDAASLRRWREAALRDDEGVAFSAALAA